MHSLIDAASGLFLSWEGEPRLPVDSFQASVEDVTLTYVDDRLTSVTGDDIDLAEVVVWDRRARQLAAADFSPPVAEPSTNQYTPEFLSRVAAAHARESYAGVQKEFGISRRQAARYISKARDAGLIAR